MQRIRKAFTLVELLVVIGIIAVLIGILMPALSRARDQANIVTCASTMKQFWTCWQMYASANKGHVIPARYQWYNPANGKAAEFGFYEGAFLGNVLKANRSAYDNTSGSLRAQDTAHIIKQVLRCKAAFHDMDPDPDVAAQLQSPANYYGDYIYNTWMGSRKRLGTTSDEEDKLNSIVNPLITQVPQNVIIMMETSKPNLIRDASGNWIVQNTLPGNNYKFYFQKATEIWTTSLAAGQPVKSLVKLHAGTPHFKSTKMNVLSADGHVSLVDPFKDFFTDLSDQKSCKEYLWDARDNNHTGWKKGVPGI